MRGEAGKVFRSEAEKRQIVERYERSGRTCKAFCERHGIALSNLQRWRSEYGSAGKHGSCGLGQIPFVEIVPQQEVRGWELELELGIGMYLRMRRTS